MFAGREQVWFTECLLSSAEAAEEPLVGGQAGISELHVW